MSLTQNFVLDLNLPKALHQTKNNNFSSNPNHTQHSVMLKHTLPTYFFFLITLKWLTW